MAKNQSLPAHLQEKDSRGEENLTKNQNLPAHLQEKDSRGEENLTMYEHHEKSTAW